MVDRQVVVYNRETGELISSIPMNQHPSASATAESGEPATRLDLASLSPAERKVVNLALDGRSVRAIATSLVVSESTVHTHLTHIYRKLGINNRLDLLALAARLPAPPAPAEQPTISGPPTAVMGRLGTALGAGVTVAAAFIGLVVPLSTVLSGPALLAVGVATRRASSEAIRRTSSPLLFGGLLCSAIAVAFGLVARVA